MKRILLSALLLLPLFAHGEELTLRQCLDSALVHNPAVAAAALDVERTRLMKGTAFDPPKTEITLKQETTGGGGPENGVYFGQEFDFPTLYVARHRSLSARNELAAARFDMLVAGVEKEVSLAYQSMVYADELLRLNGELGKIYDEFCRVAEIRLNLGEAGRLELMNAERVREKNEMERRDLRLRAEAAAADLRRLTGCRSDIFVASDGLQPMRCEYLTGSFDYAGTLRARVADGEVALAEKEIAVARNELVPSLRVGATVQALIKGFNPYHVERERFRQGDFMGFEVGISVPLFFGASRARIKAAKAEREMTLLRREADSSELASEVRKAMMQLTSLQERLVYFTSKAIPRAEEIRRVATVSYDLGDIDYLEYIANIETAYELLREYAGCIDEYNRTVIEINNLSRL